MVRQRGGNRWDKRSKWDKDRLLKELEGKSETKGRHKLHQGVVDPKIKYPRIGIAGKKFLVHRVAAYIFFDLDLFSDERNVLHKCEHKNCWSKECLYLGDQTDNNIDAYDAGSRDRFLLSRIMRNKRSR